MHLKLNFLACNGIRVVVRKEKVRVCHSVMANHCTATRSYSLSEAGSHTMFLLLQVLLV